MKNKKLLIICLVIIILSSIITTIYFINRHNKDNEQNLIDGINPVANKEILKEQTIENFTIKNVSLYTRETSSTFQATIVNNNNQEKLINELYVTFHQKDSSIQVLALKEYQIKPGETKQINITSELSLENTTKIEYEFK